MIELDWIVAWNSEYDARIQPKISDQIDFFVEYLPSSESVPCCDVIRLSGLITWKFYRCITAMALDQVKRSKTMVACSSVER